MGVGFWVWGQVPWCATAGGSSAIAQAMPLDIDLGPPCMHL